MQRGRGGPRTGPPEVSASRSVTSLLTSRSCAKWVLGSSAMEIGARPLLENLSQVGIGLNIVPAGRSACRPEEG